MSNSKKITPAKGKKTPAEIPVDVSEIIVDLVTKARKDDGWDLFKNDLVNGYIYGNGTGHYYQHSQGGDFVQRVEQLKGMSPQHSRILMSKQLFVIGNGLLLGEKPSKELLTFFNNNPNAEHIKAVRSTTELIQTFNAHIDPEYTKAHFRAAQMRGINLNRLVRLMAKDLVDHGGTYIIAHVTNGKILQQTHVPYGHVKVVKPVDGKDTKGLREFYITATGKVDDKTPCIREFDPMSEDKLQLFDLRSPHCTDGLYSYPDYISAVPWILLDGAMATFFVGFAKKGFHLGTYIKSGKTPPKEIRDQTKKEMEGKFAGIDNAGAVMFLWGADEHTEVGSFKLNTPDSYFVNQAEMVKYELRAAHGVVDPALLGTPAQINGGVVFQDPNSLVMSQQLWQSTIIAPIQFVITDHFNEVLRFNEIDATVTIDEFKPFIYESNVLRNQTNQQLVNDTRSMEDAINDPFLQPKNPNEPNPQKN